MIKIVAAPNLVVGKFEAKLQSHIEANVDAIGTIPEQYIFALRMGETAAAASALCKVPCHASIDVTVENGASICEGIITAMTVEAIQMARFAAGYIMDQSEAAASISSRSSAKITFDQVWKQSAK